MLIKTKRDENGSGCGQKTLRFLARMTKSTHASSYKRMDSEAMEKKKSKKGEEKKPEEFSKGKENKQVKEKKSKKGWKRVGQAALTTCRYIGMGAAHLSPATVYSSPDYYADPKYWNRSFSTSYKSKVPPQSPHWTSNMMFSGW